MKKRTLFLTLTLTMAMAATSLTGCGTQAKAIYDENEEASTIVQKILQKKQNQLKMIFQVQLMEIWLFIMMQLRLIMK